MSLKITDWAVEDRPRERLWQKGPSSLSDAELIAILIGSGTRNRSAVDLAHELLAMADNSLPELGKLTVADIKKLKGIGYAKAVIIAAALELGRRRKMADAAENPQIRSSADVFNIFSPLMEDLTHEEFWIMFLNRANRVTGKMKISQGGVSGTVTDVRIVMKKAIETLASGLVICHNHPSGNNSPSDADIRITQKIKEAASLMDIQLLDHLIICGKTYYSFADNGSL
jgi:DNA repair protein RadC